MVTAPLVEQRVGEFTVTVGATALVTVNTPEPVAVHPEALVMVTE